MRKGQYITCVTYFKQENFQSPYRVIWGFSLISSIENVFSQFLVVMMSTKYIFCCLQLFLECDSHILGQLNAQFHIQSIPIARIYHDLSLSLADDPMKEHECEELRGKSLMQALITTDGLGRGVVYALDDSKL